MNVHAFKNLLAAIALICFIPAVNAQFDDVYYDPDADLGYNGSTYDDLYSDEVTYYDDDEYEYYDDYDYYYSSRIRRFHRPYSGFGFYDPCYVSFSSYDPYYYDAYYYPGASIYISFGDADYWGYRNWRRWNRYNRYSYGYNWCVTPASYYYSYNSWCAPSYNYWGGYHGYHSYSNYYNNYYNTCPYPVSNYYGVTHGTVTTVNTGGTRGSYYGPRVTGNTGSSPRGPIVKPENIQPVLKGSDSGVTQSNDQPSGIGDGAKPGSVTRSNPVSVQPGEQKTPVNTVTRSDNPSDIVQEVPVDRELKRDEVAPTSRRPVFKPYPSNDDASTGSTNDRPANKPTENNTPSTRDSYTPRTNDRNVEESKPQAQPTPRSYDDRPRYTPPPSRSTPEEQKPSYRPRENNDTPSYTPPPSRNYERSDDKPSYTPPPRNNDSGRNNDRPSYSPPSRNDSQSAGRSSSSPSRESSSSGSSRSSSSGSNSSGSSSSGSPRSRG